MSDTISIVGNVATEPKQAAPGGVPITSFRLAASQRHFDRASSAWVDGNTNWYTVSVFRVLGDHALESLKKGDRILVRGRLRIRVWTTGDKSGTTAEIDADALGHDLQWGTTTFTRAENGGGSHARGGEAASEQTEQWRAPMGDTPIVDTDASTLTQEASSGDDEGDAEGDMAMAMAGGGPAETPF